MKQEQWWRDHDNNLAKVADMSSGIVSLIVPVKDFPFLPDIHPNFSVYMIVVTSLLLHTHTLTHSIIELCLCNNTLY